VQVSYTVRLNCFSKQWICCCKFDFIEFYTDVSVS
jgi:hypothetical protein